MGRFYINDGAVPGRRTPQDEYRKHGAAGSDVLNEAMAIAKGRKNEPTAGGGFTRFRFTFSGTPKAQFGWVVAAAGGIAAHAAPNGAGANLFDSLFQSAAAGPNWVNFSPSLFQNSHAGIAPYSYSPSWLSVLLTAPIQPQSFQMIEFSGEGGAWRFATGNVLIEGSVDGVAWSTVKNASPSDFVLIDTYVGGGWDCRRYYINVG